MCSNSSYEYNESLIKNFAIRDISNFTRDLDNGVMEIF